MCVSTVYSIASYYKTVWGSIFKCKWRGNKIFWLHPRTVKNILGKFDSTIQSMFKNVKILKLHDVYFLTAAILIFKVLKLLDYSPHRNRTRNSHIPWLQFPRVVPLRISYKFQFPNIWTNVRDNIKYVNTIKSFKIELQSHIF